MPDLKKVSKFYENKLNEYGSNFKAVDWGSKNSQYVRFEQLIKVISNKHEKFSIADLGCGYGEFVNFLNEKNLEFDYLGIDICKEMIEKARNNFRDRRNVSFVVGKSIPYQFDYGIASGIFSHKFELSDEAWQNHIFSVITEINKNCSKGFAFNCLTIYGDKEFRKEYLHYANPLNIFDFCKKNISKNVALLHDYNMYDFTIIVRK